jgi:hypothetical protein
LLLCAVHWRKTITFQVGSGQVLNYECWVAAQVLNYTSNWSCDSTKTDFNIKKPPMFAVLDLISVNAKYKEIMKRRVNG